MQVTLCTISRLQNDLWCVTLDVKPYTLTLRGNVLILNHSKTVEIILLPRKMQMPCQPAITVGWYRPLHRIYNSWHYCHLQLYLSVHLDGIFHAIFLAKHCWAFSAWWDFTSAIDRQQMAAFIGCSICQGCCASD